MATIGLRSGKIKPGLYRCGQYMIERQPTDYWHVIKDGSLLHQFNTMTQAYEWCRYPGMRIDAPLARSK